MNEKEISQKSYSICGNMFISFIITLAAGTLCYEESVPESFIRIYRILIFSVCVFTWIIISLVSGIQNKWQYEVFTVLFWLIPPLAIYLANDGPETFRMSITMYLLSEFFTIMFIAPAEAMGEIFQMGAVPVIFVLMLTYTVAFLVGNLFSDNLKKVITLF